VGIPEWVYLPYTQGGIYREEYTHQGASLGVIGE